MYIINRNAVSHNYTYLEHMSKWTSAALLGKLVSEFLLSSQREVINCFWGGPSDYLTTECLVSYKPLTRLASSTSPCAIKHLAFLVTCYETENVKRHIHKTILIRRTVVYIFSLKYQKVKL